ncbi:MAG TPA: Ig-like domain-containing protein, partial [Pirellulaceae bacterium]|nr:Ig-like domain-containing protein [Pirellulaceae bacterium]
TSTRFEIDAGELRLIAGVSLNHETADQITIRIIADDGTVPAFGEDFVITVNDVNEAPTDIALSNDTVDENDVGAVIGTVTVTDPDNPAEPFGQHTFTVQEDYGSGFVTSTRFEIDAGELRLIAGVSLNHETADQITIRILADDGTAPAFSEDFVITVNDVNEAPTDIALSNDTVDENDVGAVIGTVTVTDPDNPAEPFGQHTLTVQEDYGGGYVTSTRFEIVSGVLQLKAGVSLDYEDAAAITIRILAADGTIPTYSEDFVITVTDQNDLPTDITIDNHSVDENAAGAVVGNLTVIDQDSNVGPNGQHTFSVQEDYGGGYVTSTRFEVVGDVLKLIAGVSLDHETAAQITVKIIADDGSLPPFSKDLVIDVVDVNEAPTDITLGNDTVVEESPGAVVGSATVTDPDNPAEPFGQHALTVQEDYGGGYVTSTRFEIVGGVLRLIAGQSVNFEAEPQITVRILAADGTLPTFSKDFVIDVVNQNDTPVAVDNEYTTAANQIKTGNVITDNTGLGVDSDQDLNTLTIENANGTYAPGQTFTTTWGASVTVQADGSFVYDPTDSLLLKALTALDDIDDTFTYRINDGQGGVSNSATVTIHVTGVNDAPTVGPTGSDAGKEDTTSSYTFAQMLAELGYSDPDNAANTATILITNVQGGTLSLVGGTGGVGTTFNFLPDANSHASITFDYQVLDAEGAYSNTGQFTITIRPVNDAPTFNVGNQFMFEDGQLTLQLSTLFSDLETPANLASYSVTANNSIYVHVSFDLTADTVTFTLTPNFNGTASLTIRATDTGDGSDGNLDQDPLFADSSFTLDALPVDDAPVAVGELFVFAEDTNLFKAAGVLLANVTDVDADPLLNQYFGPSGVNSNGFVLVSLPQHAQFFAFNPDGSFTYVPSPNYFGNDAFSYVIYDLEGNPSNPATVQLQISPVNDPPVFSIGPKITINPVLPQPEPFASASAGPYENDQTITWQVQSADTNILPNPTVVADPNAPGQFMLQFSPAPFVNTITSITITATDSLGLSTVQVIQVELLAGQIPPSNLAFEARQTIAFPAIRDAGPIIDLSGTAAALVAQLIDSGAGGGEASSGGERQLEIYLIDPATGEVIGDAQLTLPGQSLDQLNQIFRSLPDDQYRLVLKLEDGSRRRVMDVIVRDRQPFNPGDTQDEFLIPNDQPGVTDGIPPASEPPPAPMENSLPPNEDPALPLTPAGTRDMPTVEAERASAPPWWVLAPALISSTLLQRQQRQQQATVHDTLALLGRRPWLLRHLKRPR